MLAIHFIFDNANSLGDDESSGFVKFALFMIDITGGEKYPFGFVFVMLFNLDEPPRECFNLWTMGNHWLVDNFTDSNGAPSR